MAAQGVAAQYWSAPAPASVATAGYRLAGYLDVPSSLPAGTPAEPSVVAALAWLQDEARCLRYFPRSMLHAGATRLFVYLPEAAFAGAERALAAGAPLAPLAPLGSKLCKAAHAPSLRFVMEHLRSDWDGEAWAGLRDWDLGAARDTADHHDARAEARKCQQELVYRVVTDKSACCVLGCTKHYSEARRAEPAWTRRFCLSECLGKLEPPPPENLLAVTGGLDHAMLRLPQQIVDVYLGCLDARSLRRLEATCKTLCAATMDAFAGLKLELLPHQRAALRWMLHREGRVPRALISDSSSYSSARLYHTCRKRFTCFGGAAAAATTAFAFDSLDLAIVADGDHNFVRPVRGGLFCDDPGMGKTVTTIGLILRTYKRRPQPPPGFKAQGSPPPKPTVPQLPTSSTFPFPQSQSSSSSAPS